MAERDARGREVFTVDPAIRAMGARYRLAGRDETAGAEGSGGGVDAVGAVRDDLDVGSPVRHADRDRRG